MRRTGLLSALLLSFVLVVPTSAQEAPAPPEFDLQRPVAQLRAQAAEWDDARLAAAVAAWRAAIETALDEEAAAEEAAGGATAAEAEQAALAEAGAARVRVRALAERLQVLVNALSARGADVDELRIFLTQATGELRLDNVSTEMALGLVQRWAGQTKDWLVENGPGLIFKAFVFVVILLAFWMLGRVLGGVTERALRSSRLRFSALLKNFTVGLVRKITLIVGVMIAISSVGVNIGPLLAGVGVVGFIVGFALQETLSNFAAGVMILLYRPFDVGDVVQAGSITGKVESMSLVSTTLSTPDNRAVIVPNGKIWGSEITNFTARPTRRIDLTVGISYGDDVDHALRLLREIVVAHPKVLRDPAPAIQVAKLGESSVDIVVRPWSSTSEAWDVQCELTKSIKQAFDRAGLTIPFPQREVHVVGPLGAVDGARNGKGAPAGSGSPA